MQKAQKFLNNTIWAALLVRSTRYIRDYRSESSCDSGRWSLRQSALKQWTNRRVYVYKGIHDKSCDFNGAVLRAHVDYLSEGIGFRVSVWNVGFGAFPSAVLCCTSVADNSKIDACIDSSTIEVAVANGK